MLPFINPEFAREMGIPFISNKELAQRAAALQYLTDLEEDLTIWDTCLEFDTDRQQVVCGHNVFEWIAFTERIEAAERAEERIAERKAKPAGVKASGPGA